MHAIRACVLVQRVHICETARRRELNEWHAAAQLGERETGFGATMLRRCTIIMLPKVTSSWGPRHRARQHAKPHQDAPVNAERRSLLCCSRVHCQSNVLRREGEREYAPFIPGANARRAPADADGGQRSRARASRLVLDSDRDRCVDWHPASMCSRRRCMPAYYVARMHRLKRVKLARRSDALPTASGVHHVR